MEYNFTRRKKINIPKYVDGLRERKKPERGKEEIRQKKINPTFLCCWHVEVYCDRNVVYFYRVIIFFKYFTNRQEITMLR